MKHISSAILAAALCFTLSPSSFAVNYPNIEPKAVDVTFTDAADIQHWEAVATLAKLGVMTGKEDGAFHPADTLTRAEAAKLATLILYSGSDPALLDSDKSYVPQKDSPTFTDIQGHWAEVYIEYCVERYVIFGRGDGRFDPDSQITGLELVKMALSMLGHGGYEGIVGDSWAEQTDTLARQLTPSLYQDLDGVVLTQPITRDDAAQVLYNALQAVPKVVVAEYREENGRLRAVFADATKRDGTPATLLYQCFRLESVGSLPEQPE